MTQNKEVSIEEKNRTIAEFMGVKKDGRGFYVIEGRDWALSERYYPSTLKYNCNWSWLMPVGKKIYEYLQQDLRKRPPHTCTEGDLLEVDIHCAIKEYNIEKAHEAIYHFITWYNTTLKK